MQAGVPMVPVVIRNAGEIMPAHSMILTPGTVQVRVLAPVSTGDWTVDNLDEQVALVEQLYADAWTTGSGQQPAAVAAVWALVSAAFAAARAFCAFLILADL